MIADNNNKIELLDKENAIFFYKDVWFNNEVELATSLGFKTRAKGVYIPLKHTSKKSLYDFMKVSFNNFTTTDKWKVVRQLLFDELKDRYNELYSEFYSKMSNSLPYYKDLYEHQKEAVFIISNRKYNLLSFEQGLGKTITSIASTHMQGFNKTIVVCPSIAKWNWYEELIKWGVSKDYITIVDSKKNINAIKEKWILINYEMIPKHIDKILSRKIDHLIIDEAHYIKNTNSKRFDNINSIARTTNCNITLLTGTPIKNRVDDLFAYLKLCNHYLGVSYRKFIEEYTYYHNTSYGISISRGKNLDKLNNMISNFMIRKVKSECVNLPSKIINKCIFELSDYKSDYKNIINKLSESDDTMNSIHTLNIITTKSKISSIISLTEDLIYNEKKVVLFTSYTEPYDMLMRHFEGKCVGIDGRVNSSKRQEIVNLFQNTDIPIFIGNISAAGVGINLSSATEVIFCNLPFTNAELEQAVDRLHRIGQVNNVNVYFTICKDTVDEAIYNIVCGKADDSNLAIDLYKDRVDISSLPDKLLKEILKIKKK